MKTFNPCLNILPASQKLVWKVISNNIPKHFVLYGGTAIALRLAHRQSIDFDFFTEKNFDPEKLFQTSRFSNHWKIIQLESNTLSFIIQKKDPVKLSFFGGVDFGCVGRPELAKGTSIQVASLLDLFALKLKTILQRVESKDYIDIVAILKSGITLTKGLEAALALFKNMFPPMECIKALTYFEGGDLQSLTSEQKKVLIQSTHEISKVLRPVNVISKSLSQSIK